MRFWFIFADLIRKRHIWILAAAAALTVGLAFGIPRVQFKTGQDTLVSPSSQVYRDNVAYQQQFGGEPLLVLFEGDIRSLFVSPNFERLEALRQELQSSGNFASVISPIEVAQFGAAQVEVAQAEQLKRVTADADAASKEASSDAAARGASQADQDAAGQAAYSAVLNAFLVANASDAERIGAAGEHTLSNPKFVDFLLFNADGTIRGQFTSVFPDGQHALFVGKLAGNMSIDEQAKVARDTVEMVEAKSFDGFDVTASGPAVLIQEINDKMRQSLVTMGVLAVVIMVVVLFLVFRARWGILSLPVVLMGNVWAFGFMGYLGLPLTMVTISGLPILIGLGVDFAIQFHSRIEEETERSGDALAGLRQGLSGLGPAISLALMAAVIGFMVLQISRVPMIRDFGSMLAVGAVILFIASLFVLTSLIFTRDRGKKGSGLNVPPPRRIEVSHLVRTLTSSATGRILPIALLCGVLAFAGLIMERRVTIQTDPERFISQKSPVLADLHHIEKVAGSSSELDIMVAADDITSDATLAWMADFESRTIAAHKGDLLSSNSIGSAAAAMTGGAPSRAVAEQLLSLAPPNVKANLVSSDGKTAQIVFALGPVSLDEQKRIVDAIAADLQAPPDVRAVPSGLAVIGIAALDSLSQNRGLMTMAAIGAILLGLFIFYRNVAKALAPVLPVVIAVASSSLLLGLLGVELNPLTAVAGPLIIAMGTEFTILLMTRYLEERERGGTPRQAMMIASVRIGRAITASGLTVIGGFGVLAFADFPLLEEFGRVTALNMALCLLSALVVLPALLIWADEETGLMPAPESGVRATNG